MLRPTSWSQKGQYSLAEQKSYELLEVLKKASNNFQHPIVSDASPCTLKINKIKMEGFKVYDSVEFITKFCLNKLSISKLKCLALHQICSAPKMDILPHMHKIDSALAEEVIVPQSVTCCGFSSDKGFFEPKLNAPALSNLQQEVKGGQCGMSNSRTCEIGLTYRSGITYYSVFDLLDKQSDPMH